MDRFLCSAACAGILAFLAGCGGGPQGEAPSRFDQLPPGASLQPISFTGLAEPATGRLRVVMGPQAAFGHVTEDADGNPGTVAANTAQVYGASAGFTSIPALYPAGCNPGAPQVMYADVEVFSGFKEQLRNVYARMTAKSSGPTFCTISPVGAFGAWLDPNVGLYLYEPLDGGASASSAIRRTQRWAMNLIDNSSFWFTGELWAEVIPQPPASPLPADATVFHTGGSGRMNVTFSWTDDPLADGTNPEGFLVARPVGGANFTILQCGPASSPFNSATCTTTLTTRTVTVGSYTRRLNAGRWYQWSLRSSFLLPGNASRTLGSAVTTRHLSVMSP